MLMVDPPCGWRYGFPKPMPAENRLFESAIPWLLENGYPQSEIDACGDHFYVRYWEVDHAEE
jgi:hypothetical protein